MRITVHLPDGVLKESKQHAIDQGITLSELMEDALRELLARRQQLALRRRRVRLPTFKGRGLAPGVDLHDSADLLDQMEG